MTGMDQISGAILDKVKVEAESIISEAEAKAAGNIAAAKKLKTDSIESAKNKLLAMAKAEAKKADFYDIPAKPTSKSD